MQSVKGGRERKEGEKVVNREERSRERKRKRETETDRQTERGWRHSRTHARSFFLTTVSIPSSASCNTTSLPKATFSK